jgi:transcriptional regulator with XRE-family HTH domain
MPVIGPRELARRERELRRWIGGQAHDLREDLGLTRADLARAAGLDRAHISRIELGTVSASQGTLVAIAAALGADLGVRLFPGAGPAIRDRFQAPIVEAIIRAIDPSWVVRPEVPVGKPRRGVIDLVIARGRVAIACEVQSELRRLEEVLRRAAEKESALVAEVLQDSTSRLLVIRSTVATREIARRFEATLRAAYPGRSADAFDALTTADRPWPGPAILWARLEKGRTEILRLPPRGVAVGR